MSLFKRKKNTYLDKDTIRNTIFLAKKPLDTPKVPLYRSQESKRQAFTVVEGAKE